jgi:hypothetical protein
VIVYNNRTHIGSYAHLDTKSFNCFVSTARGIFRGTTIVMTRKPDGTAKLPPIAKAYLKPLMTRSGRDRVHDYILSVLDYVGDHPHDNASTLFEPVTDQRQLLIYATESTFDGAKARRFITSYIIDKRKK